MCRRRRHGYVSKVCWFSWVADKACNYWWGCRRSRGEEELSDTLLLPALAPPTVSHAETGGRGGAEGVILWRSSTGRFPLRAQSLLVLYSVGFLWPTFPNRCRHHHHCASSDAAEVRRNDRSTPGGQAGAIPVAIRSQNTRWTAVGLQQHVNKSVFKTLIMRNDLFSPAGGSEGRVRGVQDEEQSEISRRALHFRSFWLSRAVITPG